MRCVCVDEKGVSDIPVRLLIAAVLTSLMVPLVWSAYRDLSATITEGSLGSELQRLVSAVQDVMSGGVGSRVEVRLELKGWGSCSIQRVEVGGSLEGSSADRYLVRYAISGCADGRLAPEPLTPMTTKDGSSLVLNEGTYFVTVTHCSKGSVHMAVLGRVE